MASLYDFPENCRRSILEVSNALSTDYDSAYSMILLMACLMDYNPQDQEVIDELIQLYSKQGSKKSAV